MAPDLSEVKLRMGFASSEAEDESRTNRVGAVQLAYENTTPSIEEGHER